MSDAPKNILEVLLAEDSPTDAALMEMAIAQAFPSSKTNRAVTVEEALEKLNTIGVFDLILLDLGLPPNHGIETVVKFSKWAKCIPIVVVTGAEDDDATIKACIKAGAESYIPKGEFTPSMLRRVMQIVSSRYERDVLIPAQELHNKLSPLTVEIGTMLADQLSKMEKLRKTRMAYEEQG